VLGWKWYVAAGVHSHVISSLDGRSSEGWCHQLRGGKDWLLLAVLPALCEVPEGCPAAAQACGSVVFSSGVVRLGLRFDGRGVEVEAEAEASWVVGAVLVCCAGSLLLGCDGDDELSAACTASCHLLG
jgi:hypothetical protein